MEQVRPRLGRPLTWTQAIVALVAFSNGALCADVPASTSPATPSYSDICSSDKLKDVDDEPDLDRAKKQALRTSCLNYESQVVANLTRAAKTSELSTVVAAFQAIPHLEGTITTPTASDHVGQALAQELLFKASMNIGKAIERSVNSPTIKQLYIVSDADIASQLQIAATTRWLTAASDSIGKTGEALRSAIARAKKNREAGTASGETRVFIAPGILAVPAAITAAQALAAAFKSNTTLASIPITAKNTSIMAGLASVSSLATKIHYPTYSDALAENDFSVAFAKLSDEIAESALIVDTTNEEIKAEGGLDKANKDLVNLLAAYQERVNSGQSIIDQYNKAPEASALSPYQQAIVQIAKVPIKEDSAMLLVDAASFGANGGVSTSKWRNDHLLYAANAVFTFVLLDHSGKVMMGGAIEGSARIECTPDKICTFTENDFHVSNVALSTAGS